ncbi:MAG: hypothetical protein P0116_04960 [Candidatus Nitrosocosmicus sp.]|nr:hypothetical protein [Candidatus Nitrosocosmicus sp.]
MFGFESTSDLLIVAIFVQTIVISLIILTIYLKIRKIQYKNIDLNEKIDEKLDRVESKLSYLYNQVLVISANEDKFKYPRSYLDPSAFYRTGVTTHEESVSQSLLKDTILSGQNSRDARISETGQTAKPDAIKSKDSETNPIPTIETSSISQPESAPSIISTGSYPFSNNDSFSEISTNSKRNDTAAKDTTADFVDDSNVSVDSKNIDHADLPYEKNTNPEIDKIEREILTALKRLGGSNDDYGYDYGNSKREDIIYQTAKKSDRKGKNID